MLGVFLKGIVVGIVIAVPVGPVGVLCVRRTIFEGTLFGFCSGIGAAAADTVFGIIAGFGLTVVSDWLLAFEEALRAAGGLFLLAIGWRALSNRADALPAPVSGESLARAFASTFALTISNPVTILAFAAVFAGIGFVGKEASWQAALVLVAGVFVGSLIWWLLLGFGARAVRKTARDVHLVWLNRASGVILTVSGAVLLLSLALTLAGVALPF